MATQILEQPALHPSEGDWLGELIEAVGLRRALNTVGEAGPHRLEVRVGDALWLTEVSADLGNACGVEVAAALAARAEQDAAAAAWEVRLYCPDDEAGADLMLREWRSGSSPT